MRLPPLPAEEWDDTTRSALAGMLPRDRQHPEAAGNALSTLVRHPDLTKAFLGFNIHLLFRSTLPARLRELVILRVAHRRGCAYEWGHHLVTAGAAGISDAEIAALQRGEATDDTARAVLAAVDELEEHSTVSDDTWSALSGALDERQRMDLVFTVGAYGLLAMAFNTFGVELEH
ncbi:carboxymuconolactone decarboxylase family protein [Nocardia farcinica]|uniref:carboxymuconolactone decarboxylase family protein n=1 Tax=Nocardia farcinica TaxID=37329 RepID=UPI0037BDF75A